MKIMKPISNIKSYDSFLKHSLLSDRISKELSDNINKSKILKLLKIRKERDTKLSQIIDTVFKDKFTN